jgi:spore maturation protein CgeB
MRTMVFAGEFWEGCSCQGLADGFERAGWAVQRVDLWRFFSDPAGDFALRAINRLVTDRNRRNYCRAVLEAISLTEPDVFFTVKGSYIGRDTLSKIRSRGIELVMFYPDFHFAHAGTELETIELYDIVFTSKSFQLDFLRRALPERRVEFVHHGYCSSVHRPSVNPMRESDYDYDIMYIGNHSPHKFDWMLDLRQRQPARRFGIIGNRWREHVRSTVLERCMVADEALGFAYANFMRKGRINIAVHAGRVPASGDWEDLVSTRTFEIPAAKCFMLHIDNEEIRDLFNPGSEIDVFSSGEQLSNQIDFYLARPDLRAKMIERAYRRCVPAYSYDARAQQMIGLMGIGSIPKSSDRCR